MTLTVRSSIDTLFILIWENGVITVAHLDEGVRGDTSKWLEHGLDEWVGRGIDAQPRHTPTSHHEFLPRLKEYLERQFHFTYILDREPIESEGLHEMCEGCKCFFGCDCESIEESVNLLAIERLMEL